MKLGEYFTLEEMTRSDLAARAGLSNQPNSAETEALRKLVVNILDPLRKAAGSPITVSSGFRSEKVNRLAKGESTSQHRLGEAADINIRGMTPKQVVDLIKKLRLPYDQVINEFDSWVHVSYGPRNRRHEMKATKNSRGTTVYTTIT